MNSNKYYYVLAIMIFLSIFLVYQKCSMGEVHNIMNEKFTIFYGAMDPIHYGDSIIIWINGKQECRERLRYDRMNHNQPNLLVFQKAVISNPRLRIQVKTSQSHYVYVDTTFIYSIKGIPFVDLCFSHRNRKIYVTDLLKVLEYETED